MQPDHAPFPFPMKRDIALVVSRIQDEIQSEFVRSVIAKCCEHNYRVIIFSAFTDFYAMDGYDQGEMHAFDLLSFDQTEAIIMLGTSFHNDDLLKDIAHRATSHGVFTICIDKQLDDCCYIGYDYISAFEAIVRHVVCDHKCRTINVMAGMKGNSFSDERVECCRRIMKENGLELDEDRILYGDFRPIETEREFEKFIRSGMEMPDAFICCNDAMAITVCKKLKEYGYSVPDDVIVTGFDGIPEVQYHFPKLTTAKHDITKAAELSIEILNKYFAGEPYEKSYIIRNQMDISESCGCHPVNYERLPEHTSELVKLIESDSDYDTIMFEMENVCTKISDIEELSNALLDYSGDYGKHYFAIAMKEDFMKISGSYESLVYSEVSYRHKGTNLVLCDSTGDKRYSPIYAERPPHFLDVLFGMNAFLFWSIHFQETWMGHGIMGISTGCDGKVANDDFRNLLKYTRNLNHVLEMANSHTVMHNIISKLREMYIHDRTGLYNRRGFYSKIGEMITHAREDRARKYSMIIISIDMDGLKYINDTFGHGEGDEAIKAVSNAIMSAWGSTEVCSRFGGDEFIVASICIGDPEYRSKSIINRITSHLDSFNSTAGKLYKVRGSFGSFWSEITDELSIDKLIKEADDLMYREKLTHKESRSRIINE